jgi:hypothetical protein
VGRQVSTILFPDPACPDPYFRSTAPANTLWLRGESPNLGSLRRTLRLATTRCSGVGWEANEDAGDRDPVQTVNRSLGTPGRIARGPLNLIVRPMVQSAAHYGNDAASFHALSYSDSRDSRGGNDGLDREIRNDSGEPRDRFSRYLRDRSLDGNDSLVRRGLGRRSERLLELPRQPLGLPTSSLANLSGPAAKQL